MLMNQKFPFLQVLWIAEARRLRFGHKIYTKWKILSIEVFCNCIPLLGIGQWTGAYKGNSAKPTTNTSRGSAEVNTSIIHFEVISCLSRTLVFQMCASLVCAHTYIVIPFGFLMPICLDRGQLFEDQDFPPNNKAIYNHKKPGLHPILWMRPHVSRINYFWRDP